jgi:hypothetical protein
VISGSFVCTTLVGRFEFPLEREAGEPPVVVNHADKAIIELVATSPRCIEAVAVDASEVRE